MDYYLDSNIIIYSLKGTYPSIEGYMRDLAANKIKVPALVKAELLLGAEKSSIKKKVIQAVEHFLEPFEIVPFDDACCEHYAKARASLEKKGLLIGPNDLIIASSVLSHQGCLVTHNTKEFSRVKGLIVEDWTS